MATPHGESGGGSATKDLIGIIVILIIFSIAWFMSGGFNSESAQDPFIQPPAPIGGGQTYGGDPNARPLPRSDLSPQEISEEIKRAQQEAEQIQSELRRMEGMSPLHNQLELSSVQTSTDASTEYVIIRAPETNKQPILLTGLTLKSQSTGQTAFIGQGTLLPFLGRINIKENIYLEPGGIAYIITGRSPIGTSFKLNTCIGYFEENQDFEPGLPIDCPLVVNAPRPEAPNSLNDACIDYLESLSSCTTVAVPPQELSRECQVFVAEHSNYNSCVTDNKQDRGFYYNEWRVYLGKDEPLWKTRRETILLLDTAGKTIATQTY